MPALLISTVERSRLHKRHSLPRQSKIQRNGSLTRTLLSYSVQFASLIRRPFSSKVSLTQATLIARLLNISRDSWWYHRMQSDSILIKWYQMARTTRANWCQYDTSTKVHILRVLRASQSCEIQHLHTKMASIHLSNDYQLIIAEMLSQDDGTSLGLESYELKKSLCKKHSDRLIHHYSLGLESASITLLSWCHLLSSASKPCLV